MAPDDLPANVRLGHVEVTPDGSILASGSVGGDGYEIPGIPVVVKLKPDGKPNMSFSSGGASQIDTLSGARLVELLPEAGGGMVLATATSLVKLKESGMLEGGFGVRGKVSSVSTKYLGGLPITAAGLDANGRIVVATGTYHEGLYLARFTGSGELDETFGGDGTVHIAAPHPGGLIYPTEVGFDAFGRIIVAGEIDYAGGAMRLLPDGQLDPDFGPGGNGFTGPFGDDETYGNFYGAQDLVVDPAGAIRVYGIQNRNLYFNDNMGYSFGEGGMPIGPPHNFGFGGSGVFAETPDGGIASTEGPFRHQSFGFSVVKSNADFRYGPRLSAGESNTTAIVYSPGDDTLVAVGEAEGRECTDVCRATTYGVVARIDADTGEPTPGFGTGGAMLIPQNKCSYGESEPEEVDPPTPWNRCRVKPPQFKSKIAFTNSRSRRPALSGTVKLTGAPRGPAFLKRKLEIRLPHRLKLKPGRARKRLSTTVTGTGPADTEISVKGRVVVIKVRPDFSGFDPYENDPFLPEAPPSNGPVRFKFSLKPGAFKPLPKPVRRMRLNFALRGTYAPSRTFVETDPDSNVFNEDATSVWSAPNSASTVVKVRPVKLRGRKHQP